MTERTITVAVLETGMVQCVFTGPHITKREFDRVIRTLEREYRTNIRLYRQSRKVELDGKRTESGSTEPETDLGIPGIFTTITGTNSSSGKPEAAKPGVAVTGIANASKAS